MQIEKLFEVGNLLKFVSDMHIMAPMLDATVKQCAESQILSMLSLGSIEDTEKGLILKSIKHVQK